ncbi:hypothetical protein [uncultured Albimonas sp.]|uniref:hypothetical protein n=1 Tax=uncultured Albimonas sp. TaxID=1331701 RepID=UPI0030EF7C9F|tara:strand:+ start:1240 stop:1407 length:168 start_codon:yes stop_codon:yes gene_type:complete
MTRHAHILRRAALPLILMAGLAVSACAPVGPAVPASEADGGLVIAPSYPGYQKTY